MRFLLVFVHTFIYCQICTLCIFIKPIRIIARIINFYTLYEKMASIPGGILFNVNGYMVP